MNTYGLILLFFACLYMAGLNLWLLFKDWFKERYERKKGENNQQKRVGRVGESKVDERSIPDLVGKSKWNEEQEKRKQNKLVQEVNELKAELEKIKENQAFLSVPLEKEKAQPQTSAYDQSVSSEEEIILQTKPDKSDAVLSGSQSFTMDEFEMVAKSLKGKTISKQETQRTAEIIPRMKSTDMFQQFIGQVKGAESRAMEILRMSENNESDDQSGTSDLSKFIRT